VLAVSQVVEGTHISDDFSTLSSKWIASLAEGEDANALYPGRFTVVNSGEDNTALTMAEPGKYALTQKLDQQITFDDKPLVVREDCFVRSSKILLHREKMIIRMCPRLRWPPLPLPAPGGGLTLPALSTRVRRMHEHCSLIVCKIVPWSHAGSV
jgi:hypothetical protein